MSSNSSYQTFIINTLKNTASKTDIDSLIVFDEENNLTSGKFKTLFESMGLTETDEQGRVKGKNIFNAIVETDSSGNIRTDGSGYLNTLQGSISSIESALTAIESSIQNLTTRIVTLESEVAPVITLVGESSITIPQGTTYNDPGYTASDHKDGDLTSSVVVQGSVDIYTMGVYTITYDVTDSAGLQANQVSRIVTVTHPITTG